MSSGIFYSPPNPWLIMGYEFFFLLRPKLPYFTQIHLILNNPQPPVCHSVCVLSVIDECVFLLHMFVHSFAPCVCEHVCICVCVITRGSFWNSLLNLEEHYITLQTVTFLDTHTHTDTRTYVHMQPHSLTEGWLIYIQAPAPVHIEQRWTKKSKHTEREREIRQRGHTCPSSLEAPTAHTFTDGHRKQTHMSTYYTQKLSYALDTSCSKDFSF